MDMSEEQARQIVKAINQRAMVSLGIGDDQPLISLDRISLAEMLEAATQVRALNRKSEAEAGANGGRFSISIVPADRLIAAVFVTEHYPTSKDTILMLPPDRPFGHPRGLLLYPISPDVFTPDDDEED